MNKFVKKEFIIEGYQWFPPQTDTSEGSTWVHSRYGSFLAYPGDWIIKRSSGIWDVIADKEMKKNYEPIKA